MSWSRNETTCPCNTGKYGKPAFLFRATARANLSLYISILRNVNRILKLSADKKLQPHYSYGFIVQMCYRTKLNVNMLYPFKVTTEIVGLPFVLQVFGHRTEYGTNEMVLDEQSLIFKFILRGTGLCVSNVIFIHVINTYIYTF